MLNKITGEHPQPIIEDEPVDLSHNTPAVELCEEVKRLTTEARESLLMQALTVSREHCNNLVLRLNVRVEELTRQVKNVEWYNEGLEKRMKENAEKLIDDVKASNYRLSKNIEFSLSQIVETVTEIEKIVNTTIAKAIDSATKLLNDRVKEAIDTAVLKVNESVEELIKETRKAKEEIENVEKEIRFESGFRRFMFWFTPVLAVAQTVFLIMLAL